jgi:hypothetical protein
LELALPTAAAKEMASDGGVLRYCAFYGHKTGLLDRPLQHAKFLASTAPPFFA